MPEAAPPPENPIQLEERLPASPPALPNDIPAATFRVDDIQVVGNTLFEAEIEALVTPLEGREVSLAELLELRRKITALYVGEKYVSSGAFVPNNQELDDGIVIIQVVEGTLEQLQINGLSRLGERYIRSRIGRSTEAPLNIDRLEAGLRLLQIDPLLQSVDAELAAGQGPGQSILLLDLTEADAFSGSLSTDNYRSPSIGSVEGTAGIEHLNLLGFGDRLALDYSLSEGLDSYQANYTIPLNGLAGSLQLGYQNSDSDIIEAEFVEAGIRSETESWSVNFRQPIQRSVENEFALGLGLNVKESRSFILDDIPFSFSLGPEDGVSKVNVLQFSQEWINRDVNTVLAARSQFNWGINLFDATVNNTGTDGRFFSWLGQFQWIEQFPSSRLLVTRLNAQLTPDSLLPLERFGVGGIDTVRGYSQNQIVTDNAITLSTEARFPLATRLQLTPFIDAGGGWNNQTPNPDPAFLLGTGLGLRWQPNSTLNLRLDYGIPILDAGEDGNSLQENGIYFSVNVLPF